MSYTGAGLGDPCGSFQLRIFHDPAIMRIIPMSHIWIQLRWEQHDKWTFVCPYLKPGSPARGYWENPAGAGFFLWTPGLMAQSGLQKVETFSWTFQQLCTIKLNKTKYRKACKLAQALSTRKKIQEIITMDSGNEVQLLPYWKSWHQKSGGGKNQRHLESVTFMPDRRSGFTLQINHSDHGTKTNLWAWE